jgi:hypothetical protein
MNDDTKSSSTLKEAAISLASRKFLVTITALIAVFTGTNLDPTRIAILAGIAAIYVIAEAVLDHAGLPTELTTKALDQLKDVAVKDAMPPALQASLSDEGKAALAAGDIAPTAASGKVDASAVAASVPPKTTPSPAPIADAPLTDAPRPGNTATTTPSVRRSGFSVPPAAPADPAPAPTPAIPPPAPTPTDDAKPTDGAS